MLGKSRRGQAIAANSRGESQAQASRSRNDQSPRQSCGAQTEAACTRTRRPPQTQAAGRPQGRRGRRFLEVRLRRVTIPNRSSGGALTHISGRGDASESRNLPTREIDASVRRSLVSRLCYLVGLPGFVAGAGAGLVLASLAPESAGLPRSACAFGGAGFGASPSQPIPKAARPRTIAKTRSCCIVRFSFA